MAYLEIPATVVFSVIFFQVSPSVPQLFGGIVVICSSIIFLKKDVEKQH